MFVFTLLLCKGLLLASVFANGFNYGQSYGNRRAPYAAQTAYYNRVGGPSRPNANRPSHSRPSPSRPSPNRPSPNRPPTPQWAPVNRMPSPQQTQSLARWSQQASAHPQYQYASQPRAQQPQQGSWGGPLQASYGQPQQGPPHASAHAPAQPQWSQQQVQIQGGKVMQGQHPQPQPQAGQQPAGYNIPPANVIVEQAGPPKVIFMPPEVHYGPPPKEIVEQQTKTVLMCKGTPHTVMGDHQFYSCCDNKLYYWKTEVCEDGKVKPAGEPLPAEQATPKPTQEMPRASAAPPTVPPATTSVMCNGSSFLVDAKQRQNYACCGSTLYDMRTSSCDIERLEPTTTTQAPSNTFMQKPICPVNFLCCDGYTPIPNVDEKYKCCPGAGPYDTKTQQCVPV